MKKHIFNPSVLIVAAIIATFPAAAVAGPVVGLGYSDTGLSGHSGRPGITISAGNLYKNNVIASGSATLASGYYQMDADLGKMIPAGGVSFEPYASLGFLNLNYNQYQSPYSYNQPKTIQDFYGLAGVDLNIPIGSKVALLFGGGYGHTFMNMNGNGGAVYKGMAEVGLEIAQNVTGSLDVRYLHILGASLTSYGAGLAYHFS